mmetsp:Transcript_20043/g.31509  ORF Transcript_20043/g.31509 Transcript_20043/m.31509 type:complete len:450 (-) Transcript_20043:1486-2835(-)
MHATRNQQLEHRQENRTMSTEPLGNLIHRIPGVYRDPQRVVRDAESLLSTPIGTHLRPTTEPLTLNDGSSTPPVLVLRGTIPMTYRNVTYNLPVDMYLPPPYPLRPPTVFVRPVVGMAIKENHRHVGLDGRVYLPYLHDWRPGTHELRELVMWMSSLFGSEPPCYAKPAGALPAANENANHSPPPSYGSSVTSSGNNTSSAIRGSNQSNSSAAEERRKALERDIEEANIAAQIARDEEARERRDAAAKEARERQDEETKRSRERQMQQEHKQKLNLAQVMAYSKVQDEIQRLFRSEKEELRLELKNQKQLEYGKERIHSILKEGEERKGRLEKGVREADEAIEGLETWLAAAKERQSAAPVENGDGEEKGRSKADLMALPADTHSAQMLALSAENAAIDDCVYFLDQALVRGSISVDVFLKEVRKLSKRQFMAKAHLIKIAQSRAAENR